MIKCKHRLQECFHAGKFPWTIIPCIATWVFASKPRVHKQGIQVNTSHYGDVRAAYLWCHKISDTLTKDKGFLASEHDPCLFICNDCIMVLYFLKTMHLSTSSWLQLQSWQRYYDIPWHINQLSKQWSSEAFTTTSVPIFCRLCECDGHKRRTHPSNWTTLSTYWFKAIW